MRQLLLLALVAIIHLGVPPVVLSQSFTWEHNGLPRVRPVGAPIRVYERFDPPARYDDLYWDAITCSRVVGNVPLFKQIVWLKAPGVDFFPPPRIIELLGTHARLRGLWVGGNGAPDTIVVASDWLKTDWVIKHELIHYVLQSNHLKDKQEDEDLWGRQCHAIVGFLE
jgi:hypothetical protein